MPASVPRSPEARARLRGSQLLAIADHVLFTTTAMILVAIGVMWWFAGRTDALLLTGWAGATSAVNLGHLAGCLYARRRAGGGPVSENTSRWLAVGASLCALTDFSILHYLLGAELPSDVPLLIGMAAAILATGGWLSAPMPSLGVSWTITACVSVIVQLLASDANFALPLAVLTCLFGLVLLIGIALNAHVFENMHLAREQLRSEHQLVNLLLRDFEQNSGDWLWQVDAQGLLRYLSPHAIRLLGEGALGRPWLEVLAERASDDATGADSGYQRLAAAMRGFVPFRDLCLPVRVDDHPAWWAFTATPVTDDEGRRTGWRGVGSDVTMLRQRERALERLATADALTGLSNRLQLELHLQAAIDDLPQRSPVALMLLDLDGFTRINASLGHAAGDALLRETAARLRKTAPAQAMVARVSGGCFAVLVPAPATRGSVEELGAALLARTNEPWLVAGHPLAVQVDVGVAFAPAHAQDPAELLDLAGLALQAGRAAGFGSVCFYDPQMRSDASLQQSLLAELREALRTDQFELHYLPRHAVEDGRLLAFEVVLRWHHPRRGLLAAGDFLPLAAQSGLIVPIGHWVLARACQDAAAWPPSVGLAVRLSAGALAHSELPTAVAQRLQTSGLAAQRLLLEVEERDLVPGDPGVDATLAQLHSIGVRIVLADLGGALAALARLRALPLDAVALGRQAAALQEGTANAEPASAVLRAQLEVIRALNLPVIGTGVDEDHHRQSLSRLGFHAWQGSPRKQAMTATAAAALATAADQADARKDSA